MDGPKLLRIPLSSLALQDKNLPHQKQITLLRPNISQEHHVSKSIFQLPKEDRTIRLIQSNGKENEINPPRLLDLRPILNLKSREKINNIQPTSNKVVPQLIRLPDIKRPIETKVIESPKREKPKGKRNKPKNPKLFDFRQEAAVSNKDSTKDNKNFTSPTRISPSPPPTLLSPPTFNESRHATKQKQRQPSFDFRQDEHRENQLLNIINQLLQMKNNKSRKRRAKKFHLVDIIDNIPMTSSENESNDENDSFYYGHPDNKHQRKVNNRVLNYGLTTFPEQGFSKKSTKRKPRGNKQHFDPFPGPPPASTNLTSQQNKKEPSDSWVDLIKTIKENRDSHLEKFEEESWRSLKRMTQNENKETQTARYDINQQQITKEVQTEMKEMIEIPRTQTFFIDEKDKKKKTEEFCDRVREEVIKKLEHQEQMDDKMVQTICNVGIQTDGNESPLQHTKPSEKNPHLQSPPIHLSVYGSFKLMPESGEQENDKTSNFIHVTNIDKIVQPKLNESILNTNVEVTQSELESESESESELTTKKPMIKNDKVIKKPKTFESDTNLSKSKPYSRSSRREDMGKSRLIGDLDNFSHGIAALEDIQQNIDRELRSTRMLFNTVDVLQGAFEHADSPNHDADVKGLNPYDLLQTNESFESEAKIIEKEADSMVNDDEDYITASKRDTELVNGDMEDTNYGDNYSIIFEENNDLSSKLPITTSSSFKYNDRTGEEEEKKRNVSDEEKKNEIRRRLHIKNEEEKKSELKAKQNKKREILREWMKQRQNVQRKKYLDDLETKRANEHRPFKSQSTFTKRQIDNNMTVRDEVKRAVLVEDNQQRLNAAEQLASAVINPMISPKMKTRRASMNNRYKTTQNKIPLIRENRSSRMRKNALIADVIRHERAEVRRKTSMIKPQKHKIKTKKQLQATELIETFSSINQSYEIVNSDHGSPRIPIDPDQFVTGQSFERYYRRKPTETSLLYGEDWKNSFDNTEDGPTFRSKKSSKPTFNNQNVKDILSSYGLNLDSSLFQEKSETSNLLEEVDLALIEEGDTLASNLTGSVDWNKIEQILNE